MPINSRPILDPRWAYHHRAVAQGLQICTITIYNENLSGRVYDASNNTWDTNSTAIWSGLARIQPRSTTSSKNVIGNATEVQEVEMQIDFNGNTLTGSAGAMVDIRPGNYIIVSVSPVDPMLTKFVYIVRGVINSSNPWQRSLVCEVDMESDPDA